MRGNPILRLILVTLALIGMGGVVFYLTSARYNDDEDDVRPPVLAAAAEEFVIELDSPLAPDSVRIESTGTLLADLTSDTFAKPVRVKIAASAAGHDLVIRADWHADAPRANALRVRVSRSGAIISDTTLWGDPQVADVITIPGGATE